LYCATPTCLDGHGGNVSNVVIAPSGPALWRHERACQLALTVDNEDGENQTAWHNGESDAPPQINRADLRRQPEMHSSHARRQTHRDHRRAVAYVIRLISWTSGAAARRAPRQRLRQLFAERAEERPLGECRGHNPHHVCDQEEPQQDRATWRAVDQ
jgi:hypothetical protein